MNDSANAMEGGAPSAPPFHDAGASKALAIPVSDLQAVLSSLAQQQEGLLSLGDHLARELAAVQASARRVQALLHEPGTPGVVLLAAAQPAKPPSGRPSEASFHPGRSSASLETGPSERETAVLTTPARVSRGEESVASSTETLTNTHAGDVEWKASSAETLTNTYAGDVERKAVYRVQARLGVSNTKGLVTAKVLNEAVSALGIDAYGVADMERMIECMLARGAADQPEGAASEGSSNASVPTNDSRPARLARQGPKPPKWALNRPMARLARGAADPPEGDASEGSSNASVATNDGRPARLARQETKPLRWALNRTVTMATLDPRRRPSKRRRPSGMSDWIADEPQPVVSIRMGEFVDALLTVDTWCNDKDEIRKQIAIVKEVLFSGNANKLVAELTQVRVDELAAPQPPHDPMALLEPVVAAVITLNGIFIGVRTDPAVLPGFNWLYLDLSFTLFFMCEIALRIRFTGLRLHFRGPDWLWNIFDAVVVALSALGSATEALFPSITEDSATSSFSIMRMIRLARLIRVFGIFRLRYMKELTLMVKGLLGGLRTLCSAIVLLFFTIYVIAVVLTILYATDPSVPISIATDELFTTVPRSMFTAFRCFLGDCSTSDGRPVVLLMMRTFGVQFALGYIACMMFVVFGIFNLVIAVYIESTIEASKRNKDKDRSHRVRESLHIAHTTKRLLKKFCTAHRRMTALGMSETQEQVRSILSSSDLDDIDGTTVEISRELFLNVIQDPQVQRLMDDLEIPADRAELFEMLDADGSGGLRVSELIHGLLRVRGEAKKSDVVASLLATRSMQELLNDFHCATLQHLESISSRLGDALGGRQEPRYTRPGSVIPRSSRRNGGKDMELLLLPPEGRPSALGVRHVLLMPPAKRQSTLGVPGSAEHLQRTMMV